MSQKNEQSRNSLMNKHFSHVIAKDMKHSQHRCKHREHQLVKSATRAQQHLNVCDAFK
jgi:hypothetical protein